MRSCPMTVSAARIASVVLAMSVSGSVVAQDEGLPSDDFLEYLSTLVEDEGEWIDPLELEDPIDEDSSADSAGDTLTDESQHAEETP